MPDLHAYDARRDEAAVFTLWQATLGASWPLSAARFGRILRPGTRPGDAVFVARECAALVGFVAAQARQDGMAGELVGALPLLLVEPDARRRGVGTALHDRALAALREAGARWAVAGQGAPRFWPGIPTDLPAATAFFAARGWEMTETSHDLVADLRAPLAPAIPAPMPPGITIGAATDEGEIAELLAFERREFPGWHGAYAAIAGLGDRQDFLLARRAGGPIVGALILFGPWSHPTRDDVLWSGLLGADCGGLGAVGVAGTLRGRGIGAALVARGTGLLRERGVGRACVGWTWLLDFYGRFGYRPWRGYAMGRREL